MGERQVLVRVPPEMWLALKERADSNDRTVAAEVRRAVREYVAAEGTKAAGGVVQAGAFSNGEPQP